LICSLFLLRQLDVTLCSARVDGYSQQLSSIMWLLKIDVEQLSSPDLIDYVALYSYFSYGLIKILIMLD